MNNSFIEFKIVNHNALSRLINFFKYVKTKKTEPQIDNFHKDEKLIDYFSSQDLEYFWCPTKKEAEDFWHNYYSLPKHEAKNLLDGHPWDYETVIYELGVGDYLIQECKKITPNTARLYFYPIGWPYGGTNPMKQIIKAFGMEIITVEE